MKWGRADGQEQDAGNLGFTVSYSIGKDSKHKDQAFTLLKYLGGQTGSVWTHNVGYLPSRDDVTPPTGRKIFLREAPWSRAWQFAPGFSKVINTANSELQSAYEGKETIQQALRTSRPRPAPRCALGLDVRNTSRASRRHAGVAAPEPRWR